MHATEASLKSCLNAGKLTPRDASGANILLNKHYHYGSWTTSQQQWADDILRRGGGLPEPTMKVGPGFARVIGILNIAGSRLVRPTITLMDDADQLVAIALNTKTKDVTVRRPVQGSRGWLLAQITPAGGYIETDEMTVASADLLEKLGEDTAGTALQYARKTGLCCFCNRKLTDETSTMRGYGQTCAGHYGLPW
jgi:hypothetical protein